jgi:hypothetical protein
MKLRTDTTPKSNNRDPQPQDLCSQYPRHRQLCSHQCITQPPSTLIVWPVTSLARALHRKTIIASGDPSITIATIDLILSGVSLEPESDVAEASENLLPQDGQRYLWTPSALRPSRRSGEWHAGHLRSLFAFRERAAFSSLAAAFARLSFSACSISKSDPKSASGIADTSSLVSMKKSLSGKLGGVPRERAIIAKQPDPGAPPNFL